MRRHPDLIALSHHHHRALVAARRIRLAAAEQPPARMAAARAFLLFFEGRAVAHFREEEEHLFPLLLQGAAEAPGELVRALVDHARLRALAVQLRAAVATGNVEPEQLRAAGELLEEHVRLEERHLFPLIEERAGDRIGAALEPGPATLPAADGGSAVVVDLMRATRGAGAQLGLESAQLNVTLLAWPAGAGVPTHRNDERDVLVVTLDGSATLRLDGVEHELFDHQLVLLPRGSERALEAGADGVRYLSIHGRRAPLMPGVREAPVVADGAALADPG